MAGDDIIDSPEEIEARDNMWKAFDSDGSGAINKAEFDELYPVIVSHVREAQQAKEATEKDLDACVAPAPTARACSSHAL